MIKGIGVDIIEIERMRGALDREPRMKQRVFTEEERRYCESKARPHVHYAVRFAAKEAAAKALGTGIGDLGWRDMQVRRDGRGKPSLELSGSAATRSAELGVSALYLSLSFTRKNAVASVIAIGTE
jgi:holo-[acyl-carrier protein] synthase